MTPKPKKKRGNLYIREIDLDTKNLFKAWCARRGLSMNKAIEDYMKVCAREERNLTPDRAAKVRQSKRYYRKILVRKKYGGARPCKSKTSSKDSTSPSDGAANTSM